MVHCSVKYSHTVLRGAIAITWSIFNLSKHDGLREERQPEQVSKAAARLQLPPRTWKKKTQQWQRNDNIIVGPSSFGITQHANFYFQKLPNSWFSPLGWTWFTSVRVVLLRSIRITPAQKFEVKSLGGLFRKPLGQWYLEATTGQRWSLWVKPTFFAFLEILRTARWISCFFDRNSAVVHALVFRLLRPFSFFVLPVVIIME